MKVVAIHNGMKKPFKSCAALVRWAETNNLFVTKNLSKDFTQNTANVVFKQKDGSTLEVSRFLFFTVNHNITICEHSNTHTCANHL